MSSAVASLVERGWVRTETEPSDRGRTVVDLPEQILAEAMASQEPMRSRVIDTLLDGVPEAHRSALIDALEELLGVMRERSDHTPMPT